jgi:hypothetical protein
VRELGFLPDTHGVYISRWHHGSPAHRYGLYAMYWVAGARAPRSRRTCTFNLACCWCRLWGLA